MDEWSDWESGDFLYAADKPGAEVPLAEVLHRVAVGFRRVVIDWTDGDRWVDWRIAKHTELGSPPVIMEAEHSLRGRTALVSLADEVGPDAVWVRFFLTKHDTASLDLNYQPATAAERGRVLAHKLAEILGYRFASADDPPPEEEEGPFCDFLIHRNGLPNAEGRLPTPKAPLTLEEMLRRVADRFPLAVIDRERGDQIVRAGAEARAALVGSTTDASVERQLALVGKVAHVTVRDSVDGPQFCFINPNLIGTGIQIEYESPQDRMACRPLLKRLVAELADYYCMTQDLDSETENLDD